MEFRVYGEAQIKVSVVIPTFRRPEMLSRCLEALLFQDYPASLFEIIVADDAVSEDTADLVRVFTKRVQDIHSWYVSLGGPLKTLTTVPLADPWFPPWPSQGPRVIYLPVYGTHGPAAARNAGLKAARGEVIAFLDDDCLPSTAWLKEGMSLMDQGYDGVGGRVIVPLPPNPTDHEKDTKGLEGGEFLTANCFYRKGVLEAVGGFDTRFLMAWREDSDLYFTLLERGFHLVQSPKPVVLHPVRPAPVGISLKNQKKSLYNALCYKKHPELYKSKLQPRPPYPYYGMIFGVLAFIVGCFLSSRPLVLGGIVGWGGLYARFLVKRLKGASHAPAHVLEMIVTSFMIPFLSVFWRLRGALRFRVWFC